jgi:hypothetical protein
MIKPLNDDDYTLDLGLDPKEKGSLRLMKETCPLVWFLTPKNSKGNLVVYIWTIIK